MSKLIPTVCHRSRPGTNWACVGVLLWGLAAPSWVYADLVRFETKIPHFAKRTHQENCWAEFSLGEEQNLCIPHSTWLGSYSPQGAWTGKWKAYSPVLLDESGKKKIIYRWMAMSSPENRPTRFVWVQFIERRREAMNEWLRLSRCDPMGLFSALLIGQSSPASAILQDFGILHLLNLSGIHFLALIWLIETAAAQLCAQLRIKTSAAIVLKRVATILIFGWAWCLAGAPMRVLRPLLLLAVQSLAKVSGLRLRPASPLLLAILLDAAVGVMGAQLQHTSILDALTDQGRVFYFLIVSTLILSRRGWGTLLHACLASSVYSLILTRRLSLAGIFLNWIGIPWISFVVYPVLLLRSLTPIDLSFLLLGTSRAVILALKGCLALHMFWWVGPTAMLLALVAASALWMLPSHWRLRASVIGAAGAVGIGFLHPPVQQSFRVDSADQVIQLDVGQGDGALVIDGPATDQGTRSSVGLIDTGSAKKVGESQWLDLLDRRGIFRVDWVGITHLDEDHAGGILTLSSVVPIGCAATSEEELRSPRGIRWEKALEAHGVRVTSRLEDCVPYPSLAPPKLASSGRKANENMSAFFVPLREGGFYLSAGDATAQDEIRIGAWARAQARSILTGPRILKISHHGSKTSSNPAFLKLVAPTETWISDGVGNTYGHPSPLILERLAAAHLPVHRSDEEGAMNSKTAYKSKR